MFQKADPERRDAATQYYIAYTYYRQGWGRISNDGELFAAGLKQLDVVDQIDPNYVASDDDLKLKRPAELRHEFEEGMRVMLDDFNPARLVREKMTEADIADKNPDEIAVSDDSDLMVRKLSKVARLTDAEKRRSYTLYVYLPIIFLTSALLGGLRFSATDQTFIFLKPSLVCLIFRGDAGGPVCKGSPG